MTWSVQPEPTDENERRALLAALEQALADATDAAPGYATRWWRSAFDELGGGAAAEQARREPGVIET